MNKNYDIYGRHVYRIWLAKQCTYFLLLLPDCEVPRADIVFVLDGSGSIQADNFQTMKNFVENMVDSFDISENAVRIGVIKYSSQSAVSGMADTQIKYSVLGKGQI